MNIKTMMAFVGIVLMGLVQAGPARAALQGLISN